MSFDQSLYKYSKSYRGRSLNLIPKAKVFPERETVTRKFRKVKTSFLNEGLEQKARKLATAAVCLGRYA